LSSAPAATGHFPTWNPDELGIPKAVAISITFVGLIVLFCVWAAIGLAPKPQLQPIQVTQAQLVQLPAPTPPPPPKVISPPKPLPVLIPKPLPVPSRIVVATRPPPPRHLYKPIPHPVVTHQPPPPMPVTQPAPPQPAPVQPTSGIPIYEGQMHQILEENQDVPPALAQLGISGTAMVLITVAPDGHVLSAKIVRSSGNPLIDQTALDHALHASFAAFGADMPSSSVPFVVPVYIAPQSDQSDN
jgi:periplasmic protein TonB